MVEPGRRRGRGVVLILLVLVVLAAGAGYALLAENFHAPGPGTTAVRLKVSPRESTRSVLARLAGLGALANSREVELYLRLHHRIPRIEIGTYEVPARASPADIVLMFEQGRVLLEQITVVEGARFADFRRALDAQADVAHTLRGKSDAQVMSALGHAGEDPEGRFFPDTYRFAPGTSDLTILSMAYERMAALLAKVWEQRSAELPFDTPYQALILASMVEKETGVADERARIAGVFVNRLRRGMRLQSDPTVIYGLGGQYDGTIHTRDLTTDTPYNSYTRAGLPPTPISLPGLESLLAAVQPEQTDELYFVATGQGGHHFSKTLSEHDAELRVYLARLREQQQDAARRQAAGGP
ncbi:MAG TPA: endolytic transglycosylase MltG [Steroidobacteraceae bacterium]|nr:endolytic transglycosylase MltG [Steroidobacteraceae bacterium]